MRRRLSISAVAGLAAASFYAGACGGGGSGSPAGPGGTNLSGRWTGTASYVETQFACSGEAAIVLDLTQTGATLGGNLIGNITSAGPTCATAAGQSNSGSVTGTVAGSDVTLTAAGFGTFTGTVSGNQMVGTFAGKFQDILDVSGTWRISR